MLRKLIGGISAAIWLGVLFSGQAFAQTAADKAWPDRPIKVMVPYGAGGNTDAIARLLGQRLSEVFGQSFVIDNRGGASGTLAVDAVVRAAPDGYTLLLASLPQIAVVPAMMKVAYNPMTDLVPISNIGSNSFILAVNPSLPVKTLKEFADYVRERPGKVSYASGGVGSQMNLTMALFLKRNNLDMLAVHMRGGSEPMNSVVAGHIPAAMLNASDVVQQAQSGAVRALGVSTDKRMPQMPELPTMVEAGVPDFVVSAWNGLAAPAGTPSAVVERLALETGKAMRDPKLAERFAAIGVTPNGNGPAAFSADFASAIALWGDVVRSLNIKIEEPK